MLYYENTGNAIIYYYIVPNS